MLGMAMHCQSSVVPVGIVPTTEWYFATPVSGAEVTLEIGVAARIVVVSAQADERRTASKWLL
jgi:hypothetical protein